MSMDKIRDRLWKKAAVMGIPLTAAFELLPVCNLSCKMCYVRKSMAEVQKAGGLIRAEQWLAWANEAKEEGMLFPLLTGGEPLLHPDFWEIYAGMLEMGMQVSINSNGTLIDREVAEKFAALRPVRINITLYGASEESYQKLCGNGEAFLRVRNAVKWLKYYGVPVKFNASITPYNVQDIEKLVQYAKEQEIPIQLATYMFPPVRRDERMIGQNDRLSPEEAAQARVKADFLQAEPEWFLGQAKRYSCFVPLDRLQETEHQPEKISCRAGNSSAWLSWQGNLSNCGMYNAVVIPLKDKSFTEAWKELTVQTKQLTYHSACSVCPNKHLCHACIAMVTNESGSTDGRPDYMCHMNEALAKYYQEYAARISTDRKSAETVPDDEEADCMMDKFS